LGGCRPRFPGDSKHINGIPKEEGGIKMSAKRRKKIGTKKEQKGI
jgi:hypothetical protein